MVDGRERALIADIPAGYEPGRPHRLVVAFHGRTNDNAQVRAYYGLEQPAGDPAAQRVARIGSSTARMMSEIRIWSAGWASR